MTDGIIQKTMKEFNFKYRSNPRWNTKWNEEQMQELIEKIKQEVEFSCIHSHGVCIDCHNLSIRLVGDNKSEVKLKGYEDFRFGRNLSKSMGDTKE